MSWLLIAAIVLLVVVLAVLVSRGSAKAPNDRHVTENTNVNRNIRTGGSAGPWGKF